MEDILCLRWPPRLQPISSLGRLAPKAPQDLLSRTSWLSRPGPWASLLFPQGSSLLEQKAKEPQHTAAEAPPYTEWRVLEAREQLKAAASPSDTRKSTDLLGPGWPSEPGPGFSTRTRS